MTRSSLVIGAAVMAIMVRIMLRAALYTCRQLSPPLLHARFATRAPTTDTRALRPAKPVPSVTVDADGDEITEFTMEEVERELALDPSNDDDDDNDSVNDSGAVMAHRVDASLDNDDGGAQCFIVQEDGSGNPRVIPWPFTAADIAAEDALPRRPRANPRTMRPIATGIVGKSVGGEKIRASDILVLDERDIVEHFSKGGGRGGQKVNKTNNCVHLLHQPTGTTVKCHATRSLAENRVIARKILQSKLDDLLNGPKSKNAERAKRMKKQKAKTRKRALDKYGGKDGDSGDGVVEASSGRNEPASTSVGPVPDAAPQAGGIVGAGGASATPP